MLKVRVGARDSQTGMADLILHEVAGHHVRLHVAHSTVSEGVHPTEFDAELLADRGENASAISRFSSGVPCLD